MQKHSVVYGDFTISRSLDASTSKVYQMFADKNLKEKWFKGPSKDDANEHTMDFRIGGSELNSGKFHDGVTHTFKAHYYDIVPEKRIVYCYEMYLNDNRISVSLATVEFLHDGPKTKLVLRESGAFLDEFDKPEIRKNGSIHLLDQLEKALN